MILNKDGTISAAGNNRKGKIGLSMSIDNAKLFTVIPGMKNIVKIDVGLSHSLALDNQG